MKFTASIVAATVAISAPLASAFTTPTFTRGVVRSADLCGLVSVNKKSSTHSSSCSCPSCTGAHSLACACPSCVSSHSAACACSGCSRGSALKMSETPVEEAAVEEVPVEEAAVEEAPVVEAAVEEAPVVEAAVEEAPVVEAAVEEAPVVEAAVEEAPVVEAAATESVPAEVEAMDGIASEEEAHNAERPARSSGIKKHNDDKSKNRIALADLEIGSSIDGKVKTITSYGAFLDIGARSDALLHVSRISDEYVANVADVLKQGQEVTIRIVSVDIEKNQIAVTMRSAEAEAAAGEQSGARPTRRQDRPRRSGGDQAAQAKSIKAISEKGFDDAKFIEGEVASTLDFGAFVRFDSAQVGEGLEGEVDGLVHISALAEGRTNAVSDVVKAGDKVQIRIREVDAASGRISLSMITKEQEEAAPAPRERRGGGGKGGPGPVGRGWKGQQGDPNWKKTLEEETKDQPVFEGEIPVLYRVPREVVVKNDIAEPLTMDNIEEVFRKIKEECAGETAHTNNLMRLDIGFFKEPTGLME